MGVKVKKMADTRPFFKKKLLDLHEREGKALLRELKSEAKKTLGQTLSGTNAGFKDATIKVVNDKVDRTENGVKVQARFFVADSSGKPHFVWHIVNKGRKDYVLKSNIAFRPRRPPNRTQRMSLKMKPFTGVENKFVFMRKGSTLGGFEGRHFYQTAMLDIKVRVFGRGGRFSGWELTKEEVEDDYA